MGMQLANRRLTLPQLGLCLWMVLTLSAAASNPEAATANLGHVVAEIDAGKFAAAEEHISAALGGASLTPDRRRAFEFERERMRRIRLDFPLSEAETRARVQKLVPDLRDEEFARWSAASLLEHQVIDGQTWYFKSAARNLFLISPEAAARLQTPAKPQLGPLEVPAAHHREVIAKALASKRNSVMPQTVRVTYSVTVDADAVPAGETVRAWLPFPRSIAGQQEQVRLVSSSPAGHVIAPESTLQRTVYLEQPAHAGAKPEFSITYELTIYGQYHPIDAARVVPASITPELAKFNGERAPHMVFTPAMREFSRRVVGDEQNPYLIAQKLFAAVDRTPWASAREYSTISNISDYALHAGHADCGQQTLLLMTLLRLNGIPTRWQSGWIFSDGSNDMHDWGWLYLAPYGWLPMDVTFGKFATGDAALDWFYLGGLDAYRIAFNDDFGQELVPAKQHFRSETVDSQRGEVEWKGGNLYFNQWDYDFKWQLLPESASSP